MPEVHDMKRRVKILVLLASVGLFAFVNRSVGQSSSSSAQSAAPPSAESRTFRPGTAPGLKVTDFGRSSGHTYRLNMVKGDEIISGLLEFAEKNRVKNGHFTGLGAIDKATLRWSDPVNKGSKKTEINEEAEVVSLVGSITTDKDGKPAVHAHTVVALADGSTRAGHLMSAQVSIIAEVFVTDEEVAPSSATR